MRTKNKGLRRKLGQFIFCMILCSLSLVQSFADEVFETREIFAPSVDAQVMVRENSKTGTPYVVISDPQNPRGDLASLDSNKYRRPDYRMLQKGVTAKDVGYDGPYSSKKKIYILAASLAAAGAGAAIALPVAPAAAGAGAAGSAMGPAIAAAGAGSALAVAAKKYQDHFVNLPDDYNRESESKIVETETDFYKLYVSKKETKPLV